MLSDMEMAAALIGTKSLPSGLSAIRSLSREARAYQSQKPYPLYHFRDWKTEDRGPLPVCLPLAKSIVERGAKWLFGKPVQLTVADNTALETALRDIWEDNQMDSRLRPMAKNAALDGGVVLKFAYDKSRADCPVQIMALSLIDEVRLYAHPHDALHILMARVQYSYFDAATGKTLWYREEWTDAEEVHYKEVANETLTSAEGQGDPDTYDGWEITTRAKNPFGVIPLHLVKNLETDDVWGAGDLWDPAEGNGLYRTLDRIHLTYHLMDRSNQFDSEVNPIFIDLELDDQDIDKPIQPGQPLDLHSSSEAKQGRVEMPHGGNGLRPAMMEYAKDMRKQVLEAASSVYVDQAEFSNKGNLTSAVLEQLYQPQIELNNEKRKSWGPGGLEPFLSRLARGLAAAGVPSLGVARNSADSDISIKITFGEYFAMSEDEKTAKTGRLQEQEIAGYLPHDRALEEISQMEGRTDVEALKKEIAAQPAPTPTANDPSLQTANLQNMETEIKGLTKVGGAESA